MSDLHPHSTAPYARVSRAGKPIAQRARIIEEFDRQAVPLNRRMISELTGIPINVVCWRWPALKEDGEIVWSHDEIDPVTNAEAEYYIRPPQISMQI